MEFDLPIYPNTVRESIECSKKNTIYKQMTNSFKYLSFMYNLPHKHDFNL
jgi:hypothetical protein